MSSPAALATVTATLHHMLDHHFQTTDWAPSPAPEVQVTTKPPSSAREGIITEQINIFLYSTHYNPAFSNAPMPGETRSGEHAYPPLPLVLKYLITAYGANDDDISGQKLMGQAMSLLHDHPLLGPLDFDGIKPDSKLHQQIERIRITPDSLSLDDMSKLWSSFQSVDYSLSAGYEVSVVLIESNRLAKTPLPVLKRGKDDKGVFVQPDLTPPFPTITEIEFLNQQESALLGDTLILTGHNLNGDTVTVRFTHPDLPDPLDVPAIAGGSDKQVSVQIPDSPAIWTVGIYSIEVTIAKAGEQDRTTNVLSLSLAPKVLTIDPLNQIATISGRATFTIDVSPKVRHVQRVALLLGDREVLVDDTLSFPAPPVPTDTLTFVVNDAPIGTRHIRLRIDGVDSLLVNRGATPPTYDSAMKVTIT